NAWAVGVIKNAPHPNAARLFADFFTSPAAQTVFANTQGAIAASPEAARTAKPNMALAEKGLKPFTIPPELFTPENVTKAQEFWTTVAGIR
ncbi:MAG: extracellular solute-binding protein, partial [Dehalococcoidia bacterium]|nr:extracellular solute-binding protein [Dehalococcoidia bacterium]